MRIPARARQTPFVLLDIARGWAPAPFAREWEHRDSGQGKGMQAYLIVFLGAGLGGALRHGVNLASARLFGLDFPYGTLIVNVVGSLAMGLIAEYLALKGEASQMWRLFLTTGILGGFTTFSAFSLDAALLWERGATGQAALYVAVSVALSVAGLFLGLWLVRLTNGA